MSIDIDIADARWSETEGLPANIERAVTAARDAVENADPGASVAIRLSGDAEVRQLNRTFRQKDSPTNVLSFPSDSRGDAEHFAEEAGMGDIILALETVRREAEMDGKNFESHVIHLVVHGVLHLAGYDHEEQEAAEEMESLEIEILHGLGIANPYT